MKTNNSTLSQRMSINSLSYFIVEKANEEIVILSRYSACAEKFVELFIVSNDSNDKNIMYAYHTSSSVQIYKCSDKFSGETIPFKYCSKIIKKYRPLFDALIKERTSTKLN